MKSDHDTYCKDCQRILLNWAVINKLGEFVRFLTCPVYCDRRCHMCGGNLRITNSRIKTRKVVCQSCSWIDTIAAEPFYPPLLTKKSLPPIVTHLTSTSQQDVPNYETLTIDEMRKKNSRRAVDSRNSHCGSCGVSISTNGTCRCS